jgi:hypothetical protein
LKTPKNKYFFYVLSFCAAIKLYLRCSVHRSVILFNTSKFIQRSLIFSLFIIHFSSFTFAQNNSAARYEIDAKRIGTSPVDKDALPRSREFIRLDSTYYVGWLYEGMYKYNRSADYLGYKNAIPALQKALDLFDKDFGSNMRHLLADPMTAQQNFRRLSDLFMIFSALDQCEENIEASDDAWELFDRIDKYHFQRDFFGLDSHRAWLCHRNRFFNSKKYFFLGNSIAENEKLAYSWCYRGFAYIEKNKAANDIFFGPMQSEQDEMPLYNNLALIFCYNKNYDSSEYCYQKLQESGGISWNNYGSMQAEIGNFANAINYYTRDKDRVQAGELREPYFYIPELYVYAGRTKEAINMTLGIINQSGSTPGFGWYNIALARSYLYDGQLDSCAFALDKASNFKELHIGTTLTQGQYDFTINLLKVELMDKEIDQVKFQNKGWWYSPSSLAAIASYKLQKTLTEYVVVNELAFNPERDRLVYDLFCSEGTTTFDEAWYLLKDFSPSFFEKKYEAYQTTDKRENIQRYFKLFAAKFKWENGDKEGAQKDLKWIAKTALLDTATEKLFLGRLYEGLAKGYADNDDNYNFNVYRNSYFDEYPQLAPFSGIRIKMKLNVSGIDDKITKDVISDLKDCNIEFVNEADNNTVVADIDFEKRSDKYEATINVQSVSGKNIVSNGKMIFRNADDAGPELALRLFGKSGAMVFDPPPPNEK